MWFDKDSYKRVLNTLPIKETYTKEDLLIEPLRITKENDLEIYYAPMDYVNKDALVLLLGITPGFTQMRNAIDYYIKHKDLDEETKLLNTKKHASFSGPMRKILVEMCDDCQLNDYLEIKTCHELFGAKDDLVHLTSIIRYPVFIKKENYKGSNPSMIKHPILHRFIDSIFMDELKQINKDCLIIPLGKAVSDALRTYEIDYTVLYDFPHPSPANGHRVRQFMAKKSEYEKILKKHFT